MAKESVREGDRGRGREEERERERERESRRVESGVLSSPLCLGMNSRRETNGSHFQSDGGKNHNCEKTK